MAQWWVKVKGSHPESHITLDRVVARCYLRNRKRSISFLTKPLTSKIGRVVTVGDGFSPIKTYGSFVTFVSREFIWVSPLPQILWPPKFQGSRFRMMGSQIPSCITSWLYDGKWKIQIKIQIFILKDSRTTKLGFMETSLTLSWLRPLS